MELTAHFAPKALDLEFLGSQTARRGLQRVPCPVIRTGQALAVRGIGGCGKDGLAERRAGLAVQHDAHDVSAFGLGIVEGRAHDRSGQLLFVQAGAVALGDDVPVGVFLDQDDMDVVAQPSGSAFVGFFFDGGVALGLSLYISTSKGGEHRASEQTDDQGEKKETLLLMDVRNDMCPPCGWLRLAVIFWGMGLSVPFAGLSGSGGIGIVPDAIDQQAGREFAVQPVGLA